jgi:hypothetical protein
VSQTARAVGERYAQAGTSPCGCAARCDKGAVDLGGGQARLLVPLEVVELVRIVELDIVRERW